MEDIDRRIINALHDGFPICDRPYAAVAGELGLTESELIDRLSLLVENGTLSRFGPLFDAEKLGGAVSLAAIAVPPERFDDVAALVNAKPEVAHNYRREHWFNMWFVVASDQPDRIAKVIAEIEAETGLAVIDLPKLEEFYLELRLIA